jgi:hypothetical protein
MTIINVKAWFELTSFIENNSVYFSNEELGINESESIASRFVNAYAKNKLLPYKSTPPHEIDIQVRKLLSCIYVSRNNFDDD